MFQPALLLTVTCLAAASALMGGVRAPLPAGEPDVLEAVSKTPFSVAYTTPIEKRQLALAGTGLRTKTLFHVKVYAMGLYVDPGPAAWALGKWKGRNHDALCRDGELYTELLKPNFTKAMRLVLLRNIDGDDMREAFEDSLKSRIERATKEFGMSGGAEALRAFRGHFSDDKLKRGTELIFVWFPDGRLVTVVGGKVVGTLRNGALAWALFDVYLGGRPVEPKGKRSLIDQLPKLLRETEPVPPEEADDLEHTGESKTPAEAGGEAR